MFNSLKKEYSRLEKVVQEDAYNQKIPSYAPAEDVLMVISLITNEDYTQNDMRIKQATHTALTQDNVEIGDIIGDQYEVTFVNTAGRENLVFLKEMESNGIFC